MSTVFRTKQRCAVCGEVNEYAVLGSTNAFGSPDLDLRPPEMQRSTMYLWVRECPGCGYVAEDVEEETTVGADFLQTPEYRSCGGIGFGSSLAARFCRAHLIDLQVGRIPEAFHALLHAAWACDDAGEEENAVRCRTLALDLVTALIDRKEDDLETLHLMKADLLRRTGRFAELKARYEGFTFGEELPDRILAFQLARAEAGDTACHRIADAVS